MAVAYASGIAVPLLGIDLPVALLGLTFLLSLACLWRRPWPVGVLLAAVLSGVIAGTTFARSAARDCRLDLPRAWEGSVEGRFLTRPGLQGTYPFRIEADGPGIATPRGECGKVVRGSLAPGGSVPLAGERILAGARWEGRSFPETGRAEWAGRLRLEARWEPTGGGGLVGRGLSLRGRVQERMVQLWGERSGPLVEALILSRREHLDPGLEDAFALSGTAHLLAISGFHVAVVAGLLLGLLRAMGARHRPAGLVAAGACWAYVLGIGAPQAAVRACLLLTLLALARLRGRPVVGIGALGSVLLLLLVVSPGWVASVGFQLSFLCTAGLMLFQPLVTRGLQELWRRTTGRAFPRRQERGIGPALLRGITEGLAAGAAATLPILPLLAWHFDRISLVGIPATIVLAPVFAIAIAGIAVSLLLSIVSLPLGTFLAGGTAVFLTGAEELVRWTAALPGASFWVSRGGLVAALVGGGLAHVALRRGFPGRVRPGVRRLGAAGAAAALVLVHPLVQRTRDLEVHVIDVGQGDAIALRFPTGDWLLVDAGPRSPSFDAGERRVVPYLKRWGVRRLEAVVLTHPHLDHIGGASAVLQSFDVRGVLDASRPYGSDAYLEVLEVAGQEGAEWWTAGSGRGFSIGEARVTVLHPGPSSPGAPPPEDPNDLSIVLLVRWRATSILLTGDAPAAVEQALLGEVPALTLLKVGHHGSRTATSTALLASAHPLLAVVSAGEGNTFGHPHREVVDLLESQGVPLFRTDRDGDIRIRIAPDGSLQAGTAR